MFKSEHDMRAGGQLGRVARRRVTDTICPYCGVGCTLELHVQDNRSSRSPRRSTTPITRGNLCIKGRFGFEYVQNRAPDGASGV